MKNLKSCLPKGLLDTALLLISISLNMYSSILVSLNFITFLSV